MLDVKQTALVLLLLDQMSRQDSWCGETHVQKCAFFLQEGLKVPLGFEFIMYKYGPFSFELRGALGELRGNLLLDVVPQPPYGPSLVLTSNGDTVLSKVRAHTQAYEEKMTFVAEQLSQRNVTELEKLATALFVVKRIEAPQADWSSEFISLKPHISMEEAQEALTETQKILEQAKAL